MNAKTYFTPEIEAAISRWFEALRPPQAVRGRLRARFCRLKMTAEQIDADAASLLSVKQKPLIP